MEPSGEIDAIRIRNTFSESGVNENFRTLGWGVSESHTSRKGRGQRPSQQRLL